MTAQRSNEFGFAAAYDVPIPYLERIRTYYQALGYGAPYEWAHYADVPFHRLRKPLAQSRVALITTAAPYQPDKGDQGPGAPYNSAAKFYTVYSGDTARDHDLRISHVAIDRAHTTAEDPASYFPLLKTSATTPSGAPKDKFHFTYPTSTWEQLSQSGVSVGYGAIFFLVQASPPRRILVGYVQPATSSQTSTPALAAALVRGDAILQIDGVDAVNATGDANLATLNEGLSPTQAATHTFLVQDPGASGTRTVSMAAQTINETTVPVATKLPFNNTQVGYMLFND